MRAIVGPLVWAMLLLAPISIVSGLMIDPVESNVHYDSQVELSWVDSGESLSIEVQDPNENVVFLWNNDSGVDGNGSIQIAFDVPSLGEYSVFATTRINDTELWADTSFALVSPELSISSIDVDGILAVNRSIRIDGEVANNGILDSTSQLVLSVTSSNSSRYTVVSTIVIDGLDTYEFSFNWTPDRIGNYTIVAEVRSLDPSEFDRSDNSMTAHVRIKEAPRPNSALSDSEDEVINITLVMVVVSACASATLISMLAVERTRFLLFCGLAPLYHKIGSKDLFNNEIRGMVFGYITANEGSNYSTIKRDLKLPNGTLAYHLKVLTRHGHVISIRDGGLKRFYTRTAVPKGRKLRSMSETQEAIIKRLAVNPGLTQKDLADALNLTQSAISYNMNILEKKGLVVSVGRKNIQYLLSPGPVNYRCIHCGMDFSAESASFCPKCGERVDNGNLGRGRRS